MASPRRDQAYEAVTDPVETWRHAIPRLRAEKESLKLLLSSLSSEERDAQEQLESLTYALGLTKRELERRRRSNNELSSAYESLTGEAEFGDDAVQQLEGELLNAKRDSANMEYEVERLEFRLKKLYESSHWEPESPHMAQSPRISLSSPIATASPGVKHGRLIGDVDSVIRIHHTYVPCRLGVSAGGTLGIYSYDSPEVMLLLDEDVSLRELSEEDTEALKEWLRSVHVVCGGTDAELVGLSEGVKACIQIVREVGGGIDEVMLK